MLLVTDPHLQMGGGGGGVGSHPDPEIRAVPDLQKKIFFSPSGIFSLKIRGGHGHWLLKEKRLVTA